MKNAVGAAIAAFIFTACGGTQSSLPNAPAAAPDRQTATPAVRIAPHTAQCCIVGAIAVDLNGNPWFVTGGSQQSAGARLAHFDGMKLHFTRPPTLPSGSSAGYKPFYENTVSAIGATAIAAVAQQAYGQCCAAAALSQPGGPNHVFGDVYFTHFAPPALFPQYDPSSERIWTGYSSGYAGFTQLLGVDPPSGKTLDTIALPEPSQIAAIAVRANVDTIYLYGSAKAYGSAILVVSKSRRAYVTAYALPPGSSIASNAVNPIAIGKDGALWFVDDGKNAIGRMTRGGDFTSYPIPTANASPNSITAACDGSLWFTEFAGKKIGRLMKSGRIVEYSAHVRTALLGIAAAPCGCSAPNRLWFTSSQTFAQITY